MPLFLNALSLVCENLEVNNMNNSISKEEKRNLILDYAKKRYEQENHLVSKREIRSIFHLELYNYFENIFDMYQHLGIEVPLCYCPREYAITKILNYVKNQSSKRLYPGLKEVEKVLGISLWTYFKNMRDLYSKAGIDYQLHLEKVNKDGFHSPQKVEKQKERIVNYIKERNSLGYFAGVSEIQHILGLKFYKYFESPEEAYKIANIDYKRICPIILGKNKEKILTEIVLRLLVESGYTIKRTSIFDNKKFNRGPDIEVLDNQGNKTLVEIKAYHNRYWITKREIQQLKRYMEKMNISKGLFITTANKAFHNPKDIQIINGEKLISLLKTAHLSKFIEQINWIQEEKVNQMVRENAHQKKKEDIIKYVLSMEKIPTQRQIEKDLKLSLKTYFSSPPYRTLLNEIKKN